MKLLAPAAVTRTPNPDTSASYVIPYPLSGDCNWVTSLSVIFSAIAIPNVRAMSTPEQALPVATLTCAVVICQRNIIALPTLIAWTQAKP